MHTGICRAKRLVEQENLKLSEAWSLLNASHVSCGCPNAEVMVFSALTSRLRLWTWGKYILLPIAIVETYTFCFLMSHIPRSRPSSNNRDCHWVATEITGSLSLISVEWYHLILSLEPPSPEYFTLPHHQALESTGCPETWKWQISAKFTNQNPKNSIGPSIDIHRLNRIRRNPWNIHRHTYSQPRTPKWLLLLLI